MARLDSLFRFSFYLCLLISTVSLAFTAWGQLPETLFFYLPMLALVVLAYWLNDRFTLSARASNLLAVGIITAWPLWLVVTLRRSQLRGEDLEIELVRLALPFFAPLLSTLLLAKLFRPKAVRDYWTIHLMGLVQMVLACVLAMTNRLDRDAPLFPLAVLAYLLTLVWTLRNFNLYSLYMQPGAGVDGAEAGPSAMARIRLGLRSSLGWFVLATLVGLVIFFLIPRGATSLTGGTFANMAPVAQAGFKPSMDLSGEGQLQISEELVFRASIRNPQGEAVQLARTPKWRGVSCVEYRDGRWQPFRKDLTGYDRRTPPLPPRGTYLISYDLDIRKVRQGGVISTNDVPNRVVGEIPLFTLETLNLSGPRGGVRPSVWLDPNSPPGDFMSVFPHYSQSEGCVSVTLQQNRPSRGISYQQLIEQNMVGLAEWRQYVADSESGRAMQDYISSLRQPSARLFATGRMKTLAEQFLAAEKVPATASPKEKARALEKHLAQNSAFAYSLNRRRVDMALDPNEDFLMNVKEGTCERYASALALLLRAIGIPARVVIGFRGADWNTLGQYYEVRECHAHAWVEAVVAVEEAPAASNRGVQPLLSLTWVSLDPTPSTDADNRDRNFWAQNVSFARMLWEFFILDFSGDLQRQRFFNQLNQLGYDRLESALRRYGTLGVVLWIVAFVLSLILAVLLLRLGQRAVRNWRWNRKAYAWLPREPFYRRWLNLLMKRWKLKPVQTQTAAEFAAVASDALKGQPATRDLAHLPEEVANDYYAVRFGGQDPADAAARAATSLTALQQA